MRAGSAGAVSGERWAASGECCIGGGTLTAMRRECALPRELPRKTSATAQKRHAVTSISGLQWIMKTACRGAVDMGGEPCGDVCGAVWAERAWHIHRSPITPSATSLAL